MAYIIQTDLLTQIQQQELTKIQTGNATVLPSSIGIAMEEMRSYLVPKYNMAAEFTDSRYRTCNMGFTAALPC